MCKPHKANGAKNQEAPSVRRACQDKEEEWHFPEEEAKLEKLSEEDYLIFRLTSLLRWLLFNPKI